MGEQKNFRSEQSRKNYEKLEKQREAAARRKAHRTKRAAATDKASAWLKANPGKAALIAVVLVAVIVGLWLGCKAVFNPLAGRQDNWLILDVSSSSNDPSYRHLADFSIPEGYTRGDYSLYNDGVQQDFYCTAADESSVIQDAYITGAKGIVAAEYPATILAYGLHKEAGEPRTLTINGEECSALYLVSDESEWSGEGMGIAHMSFYFATGYNACVSATFRSGTLPMEELPDEASMLAEAEKILSRLTLVK